MNAPTGAIDRSAWQGELERRVTAAYRGRYPLVIVLLDLDHFAAYEAQHGREAGEQLLLDAGEAWRAHVRPDDLLVRYGEGQFGVILSRVQLRAAERIIARLREATPGAQTFSAGVALWNGSEDWQALVARAVEALEAAKEGGRNRSVVHGTTALI
ncbi:diguanylate cyclase (GGDEF)-like protein [Catenuloplanes nepalensis]|uniref:Diguanylate cyclase (GGDEF)-like protein n=1 Tax=Catenuloplanes nepalensis TaxID=587533 RepID=A0ABT9N312_9ACTN|nr:GGDEF domain-containing protein [Catenuloplanes nepalensis]MDP9798085.1 diguanylate cyclase (GGDEF)-like protein [Catenuloplanes nepalensis]